MFTRLMRVTSFIAGDIEVRFIADSQLRLFGSPYKVFILRKGQEIARDWMGREYHPSKKNARLYYEKHVKGAA